MRIRYGTLLALAGVIVWLAGAAGAPAAEVAQAGDGAVTLGASDVTIDGPNARIEEGEPKSVAWWTNVDTSLHWNAKIVKPGKYRVELNFAVFGSGNRDELAIAVGSQKTDAYLTPGNGMNDFRWGQAGQVDIAQAGNFSVSVTPVLKTRECVIYLRSVVLRPIGSPTQAVDISGGPIKPAADGTYSLAAQDAEIDGMNAVLETKGGVKDIGFWMNRDTSLRWVLDIAKPGKYRVELNYSLTPTSAGSKVAVRVGDDSLTARPKPADYVIDLRSVTLAPADAPPSASIDIADTPLRQAHDGSIKLTALDAEIDGQVARLEGGDRKYIVWWGSRESSITWPVAIEKPGRFNVMVNYSLAETGSSSDVTLTAAGQSITGRLPPTPGWDFPKTAKLGTLEIGQAGDLQVGIASPMDPGLHIINLRGVDLVPARK
jgi:hypothetical protein